MSTFDLRVSIAPLSKRDVEYFEEISIPLTITSECAVSLVVESVTLKFQTDSGMADYSEKHDIAKEVAPSGLLATNILVCPTLEFLNSTNSFHVMVRYKRIENGMPADQTVAKSPGTFLLVKHCSQKLGQIFISFKQPEDRPLARILQRVAERAGFEAYLKMDESNVGVDSWDVIEPRLLESIAVAFIWTEQTEWGEGVEKEIELAKKHCIHYVPLIQQDMDVPSHFKDSPIEYQRFDPEGPLGQFAQAIASLRETVLVKLLS